MRVVCVVAGGNLVAVYSDNEDIDVELLDYDNMRACQPVDGESNEEYEGYKYLEAEVNDGSMHCVYG